MSDNIENLKITVIICLFPLILITFCLGSWLLCDHVCPVSNVLLWLVTDISLPSTQAQHKLLLCPVQPVRTV